MIGRFVKSVGSKLALTFLGVVLVASAGLATYASLSHSGNWFDGVSPINVTATVGHTLLVFAPTLGHIWADVEEPLGRQIVMQVTADDGACSRTSHSLNQSQSYYGFFAQVTNWQSGIGTAYLADAYQTLPPCSQQ